jgi:WD40 repeat protein
MDQGWAYSAVLQASYFLRACAVQSLGASSSLQLAEDEELPAISSTAMAAVLASQLPVPAPSEGALLEAGGALQVLFSGPLPICTPAAIFQAPYSGALAALSSPARVALLLACDFAALPAPTLAVVIACTAQHYGSLPLATFEAELAALSPRCASLVRGWWASSFDSPALQWWEGMYGEPPDCRAWLTTPLFSAPAERVSLPPVAFGLEESAAAEEYWARGRDKSGQRPPPSYAALLAMAFGMREWVQRHHPGLLVACALQLERGEDWCMGVMQAGTGDAYTALLCCEMLRRYKQEQPRGRLGEYGDSVRSALLAHTLDAGVVLAAHELLIAWVVEEVAVSSSSGCELAAMAGQGLLVPPSVVAALRAHAGDAAAAGTLCRAIQRHAAGPGRAAWVAHSGTAEAVVQAMTVCGGDARLALHGCEALLELVRGGAGSAAVVAAAAPAVVAALQAHAPNAAVAGAACAALLCMAMWEREACAAAGARAALEKGLMHAPAQSRYAVSAQAALGRVLQAPVPWRRLVSVSSIAGVGRVWDVAAGVCAQVLKMIPGGAGCMCALEGGRLACGSADSKKLVVWDVASAVSLQVLEGHTKRVVCVCALGGGRIVSGSGDKTLRVWDATTGVCLLVLTGHTESITCVCTVGDERAVSGSRDGMLRVWDAATGACLHVLDVRSSTVHCVCALGDGRIVSSSDNSTLKVWNLSTGACMLVLKGHAYWVNSVCAVEGGLIVSASEDYTLRVWDVATGGCVQVMGEHTRSVNGVCALGGGLIASIASDLTMRVWDVATGVCVRVLGVTDSAFSMCVLN